MSYVVNSNVEEAFKAALRPGALSEKRGLHHFGPLPLEQAVYLLLL